MKLNHMRETGFRDFIEKILYLFQNDFGCFDIIPLEEREPYIENIISWLFTYPLSKGILDASDAIRPKTKSQKNEKSNVTIKKDLKIITDLERLIIERGKVKLDIDALPETNLIRPKIHEELLILTDKLKKDLKDRRFEIFQKEFYYQPTQTTLNDLQAIFDSIKNKYHIHGCIKQLEGLVTQINN